MNIGNIALPNPVALAPMAGVTDLPFRQLCRRLGAGYVVGEMLASDPAHRDSTKSRLRGVHLEEPEPRAIQIVGWDPQMLAEAARYNVDQGASVIDINMGCPAKKVCKRDAGSALLGDTVQVRRILQAVVAAVDVPVTLKIRTGLCPDRRNAIEVAGIAEDSGIAALAIHGRTRACKYRGQAEYDTIRDVVATVSIPVFANGDITTPQQAAQVKSYTGACGVMLGRGVHGMPWLPGQVAGYLETGQLPAGPDLHRQRCIVLEHIDAIHAFYGESRGVRIARKHIKWYCASRPDSHHFLQSCNQAGSAAEQSRLVSDYFNRLLDAHGPADRSQSCGSPGLPNWQNLIQYRTAPGQGVTLRAEQSPGHGQ